MLEKQDDDGTIESTDRLEADTQNPAVDEHSDRNTPELGSEDEGNEVDSENTVESERYKNAQARMTQALQEASELRQEVAALRETVSSMQNRKAPEAPTTNTSPEDPALAKLRSEYPDFAGPIVDTLERQQGVIAELRAQSEVAATAAEETRKNTFIQSVKLAHPDMDEIVTSDNFKGWLYRQAPFVQDAVVNGDSASAIQVLSMYKQGNQQLDTKSELLDAARQVASPAVGRNTKAPATAKEPQFTRQQISEMTPEEFEKNEQAIDRAMSAGAIF